MNSSFFHIEKTLSPKFQNEINISIVFNYLREKGPISRTQISKDLGLSIPAVSRVVCILAKSGYIFEVGQAKTSVGKRPTLLKINNEGYVIGVDLGKRKIKIALTNFYGDFIFEDTGFDTPSNVDVDDKKFVKDLIIFIRSIKNEAERKKIVEVDTLKAICFAVSAPVFLETEKIVDIPLYGNYRKIDFKKVFKKEFKVPIFIENDVNCSAYAEKTLIKDKQISDIIFIEISRGIGSGIIINNSIFKGSHGTSGEIGNSIVNTDNLDFEIKNKGFLEKYASVEGIKKSAINGIKGGEDTLLSQIVVGKIEEIEAKDVCFAAFKKDKMAVDIINKSVDFLSISILNLILIIDPQVVILGGDICALPEAEALFLNPIISKINSALPFKMPIIRFSLVGKDIGVLGASLIAIENLILEEFPFRMSF